MRRMARRRAVGSLLDWWQADTVRLEVGMGPVWLLPRHPGMAGPVRGQSRPQTMDCLAGRRRPLT